MKLKLFIITLLAIMMAGCTLETIPKPEQEEGKIVTISANISPDTRVSYNDGTRKLAWESGDKLLLAGYDAGGTYIDCAPFEYDGGNSFTGTEVKGADIYKAYYPAEAILLDNNGNVQLADNFWQQTQSGNNTTAHLRNKLLLFDETANPLNQTFSLVLKNSIIRFDLTNVPQEVGTLSHIDWTEETATGVFKSMTLHVTGVTFSATNSSLTAYLSFDPAAMKIIAGGKYMVALYGEQLSFQSNTVTTEKNYAAGDRYKGAINNWSPAIDWINPLSYFAEHNMANLTGTFEADHDATGEYLFDWNDAMTAYNTTPATLGGKDYYLPTIQEWRAIIPESSTYINFNNTWSTRTLSNAAVTVGGESYTMNGTFENIGSVVYATLTYTHQSNPTLYAIVRYRKENLVAGNPNARMVVDMKKTATQYTIQQAKDADWNSVAVVSRVFPAAGYRTSTGTPIHQGEWSYYWSSTVDSGSNVWNMFFNGNYAYSVSYNSTRRHSVRLVSR